MPGGRIPWERQNGDDVEAMIAMFVVGDRPGTLRVSPGQGDGGIDLLWRGSDSAKKVEIYQVKRHSQRLIASQKNKIKKSLERALGRCAKNRWTLTKWHLVLPLDFTEKEMQWFTDLCKSHGVHGKVVGLAQVELWCAKHPYVVDYYLRDGSEAVGSHVSDLTRIVDGLGPVAELKARPADEDFTVDTAANIIDIATNALNLQDPHYEYRVLTSFGSVPPPDHALFVTQRETHRADGSVLTVQIFERFHGAHQFRPIPMSVKFHAVTGSDAHRQLTEFRQHGRPFDEPIPATVSIDLPGGMAIENSVGRLLIGAPGQGDLVDGERLLEVLDEDGQTAASVRVDIGDFHVSPDRKGASTRLGDRSGLLTGELLSRLTDDGLIAGKLKLRTSGVDGRFPDEVLDVLEFMSALAGGSQLRMRMPRGPVANAITMSIPERRPESDASALAKFARALCTVQESIPGGIKIPDELLPEEAVSVRRAAALLEGRELGYTWHDVTASLDEGVDWDPILNVLFSAEGTPMRHEGPLVVTVAAIDYVVGTVTSHFGRAVSDPDSVSVSDDGARQITIRPHQSDSSMVAVGTRERDQWLQQPAVE